MPLALIMSSFVSGSRVGGFPQALVLSLHDVDPVLAPTVLFGRRPDLGGGPGGGPVEDALFASLIGGVEAHGLFGLTDAVITGYFATAAQVRTAADTIDRVRLAPREEAFAPRCVIVVDPIMGDEPGGLYVKEEIAAALTQHLLPRADVLTPNLWELRRLTGTDACDVEGAVAAARALKLPALVTSVPVGATEIGAVYVDAEGATLFAHHRFEEPPHGTGDVVAAVLAAALIEGLEPVDAAERAIRAAAETVTAAMEWNSSELPLVALGDRLIEPTASVRVERLD